jgi:hypothetical protein
MVPAIPAFLPLPLPFRTLCPFRIHGLRRPSGSVGVIEKCTKRAASLVVSFDGILIDCEVFPYPGWLTITPIIIVTTRVIPLGLVAITANPTSRFSVLRDSHCSSSKGSKRDGNSKADNPHPSVHLVSPTLLFELDSSLAPFSAVPNVLKLNKHNYCAKPWRTLVDCRTT